MSVKDQLEQHHIDGSHTTVKSKRSTNTGVVSQFNKEAAWQEQQYGGYAGKISCMQGILHFCVGVPFTYFTLLNVTSFISHYINVYLFFTLLCSHC
jgi:hypothetical protein